jgi:hypothetical protein
MKGRWLCAAFITIVCAVTGFNDCFGGSVDTYLKELKDKDPAIRANAAYELSCG